MDAVKVGKRGKRRRKEQTEKSEKKGGRNRHRKGDFIKGLKWADAVVYNS